MNIEFMSYKLSPEVEFGNIEYKKETLINTEYKINKLGTQMLYRLYQGSGYTTYYLGVADDGNIVGLSENDLNKSFKILQKVSKNIYAKLINFNKMKAKDKDKFYMKIVFKKTLNNRFNF